MAPLNCTCSLNLVQAQNFQWHHLAFSHRIRFLDPSCLSERRKHNWEPIKYSFSISEANTIFRHETNMPGKHTSVSYWIVTQNRCWWICLFQVLRCTHNMSIATKFTEATEAHFFPRFTSSFLKMLVRFQEHKFIFQLQDSTFTVVRAKNQTPLDTFCPIIISTFIHKF